MEKVVIFLEKWNSVIFPKTIFKMTTTMQYLRAKSKERSRQRIKYMKYLRAKSKENSRQRKKAMKYYGEKMKRNNREIGKAIKHFFKIKR